MVVEHHPSRPAFLPEVGRGLKQKLLAGLVVQNPGENGYRRQRAEYKQPKRTAAEGAPKQ